MTNKEAIEILKDLWRYENSKYSDTDIRYALDLAIKALKILELDDIDIDGTYWLYYDDNGNLRENKE